MQKHVNLVDLVKSFPTTIYLQNLASIQKRTSLVKFAHLAEKSGEGSISNLSTKVQTLVEAHRSQVELLQSRVEALAMEVESLSGVRLERNSAGGPELSSPRSSFACKLSKSSSACSYVFSNFYSNFGKL